ncbi:TPA: D-alanyl-D-alanine carboxypeptidase [Streptococcus equi subsp. zooepidemicus]|uniref:D-alanyl-D-alanine carboxypeptidase n=1 Tax=Streptococcus equi subsp. zooepidemicus Sz4is TaxID=1381082 RepID=A0AAW3GJN8_STRSZ|nr:D-alanyl-D-alanine carboxypeptidase [Streptococcus equi subsp. zooepidemicus Sz4is]HEL0567412.1 D-alanyl-D-alanine carboxypeptidase [Streptococcus equi subsp. zooepidemicus]
MVKNKKRKIIGKILLIFIVCALCGGTYICYKKPTIIKDTQNLIKSWINGSSKIKGYNAKSLIVVDRKYNEIFISKRETEKQLPASLAKLFVIEYAMEHCDLNDEILVKQDVLNMVKPGSSVANLKQTNYYVKNIVAAMLIPSGNDAAYVLADYVGGKLDASADTSEERVKAFIDGLNIYLKERGYENTLINDPSGFDYEAKTTVLDIKKSVDKLLQNTWFREMVSISHYNANLPDGSIQSWKNTNVFLDKTSKLYNENVIGIKTGSLEDDYNLIVLYKKHDKEFLICSIGSESNASRYDDVKYILDTIDESSYLKK